MSVTLSSLAELRAGDDFPAAGVQVVARGPVGDDETFGFVLRCNHAELSFRLSRGECSCTFCGFTRRLPSDFPSRIEHVSWETAQKLAEGSDGG